MINSHSSWNNDLDTMVVEEKILTDSLRNRAIPSSMYYNRNGLNTNRQLIVLNTCYECDVNTYYFMAEELVKNGYTVIVIRHEIEGDSALAFSGDIYKLRYPVWERGVKNVEFAVKYAKRKMPELKNVHLIGHSNGGDIAVLYGKLYPKKVKNVITFDHRRMPIPLQSKPHFASIRGDQYVPDEGVIPSEESLQKWDIHILYMTQTLHMDLCDQGTIEQKELIKKFVLNNLK